jgi:hypothetical protein
VFVRALKMHQKAVFVDLLALVGTTSTKDPGLECCRQVVSLRKTTISR